MKQKSICIGGIPYSTKAQYKGWAIKIIGYDINTERHLIIKNSFGEKERIELDNNQLELTEVK